MDNFARCQTKHDNAIPESEDTCPECDAPISIDKHGEWSCDECDGGYEPDYESMIEEY